jgi:hypothetical protein
MICNVHCVFATMAKVKNSPLVEKDQKVGVVEERGSQLVIVSAIKTIEITNQTIKGLKMKKIGKLQWKTVA